MRKLLLACLLLQALFTYAQYDLKNYTVSSYLREDCSTYIMLPLFPKETKKDALNKLLINALTKHHFLFEQQLVNLTAFYEERQYKGDSVLGFTIMAGCTFARKGIYSFTGCPYNACDKKPQSEMETVMAVLDSTKGKLLVLKDIIAPAKYDSLVNFVIMIANRYRIKTIPSCSYSSTTPVVVNSSNGSSTPGNEVTYGNQLDTKFYIKPDALVLHLLAQHSRYAYATVELNIPIRLMAYFLKPEYASRILP
jgi:hypothetical protein